MRLTGASALLLLAALAGCGGAPDVPAGNATAEATGNASAPAIPGPDNGTSAENAQPSAEPPLDRLGKVRVGATLAALAGVGLVVDRRDEPFDEGSTCGYASFKGMPDVGAMLDGETVVRIDVHGADHATLGGVRVGQSEAEALRRLGSRAKVEPHPYTGPEGHYLVVHPAGAPFGLIVETDGRTVGSWRIGRWEEVQWIEGCA